MVGNATIHGVKDNGTPISITGYASIVIDKMSARHNFDSKYLQDTQGFDIGCVATNENVDVSMDFTPIGASETAAAAVAVFIIPLSRVDLANVKLQGALGSTPATKIFDGKYHYTGGATIDMSKNDFGKISGVGIKKYANVTQNDTMTTTPGA